MKKLLFLTITLAVTLLYAQEPTGKHLFILSGQSNMQKFNEKMTFVPMIEKEFGADNVIIVKDAHGGQPIKRWYKQWEDPDGKNPNGDLYDLLMSKVKPAIEGQDIADVTFLWMQGEANARGEKYAAPYEEALKGLYAQLCQDMGRDDIFFVIGRISDNGVNGTNPKFKYWDQIRTAQENVAASDPKFALINTDDLNDGVDKKGNPQVNGLHYTQEGYGLFGERLAEAAIRFIKQ